MTRLQDFINKHTPKCECCPRKGTHWRKIKGRYKWICEECKRYLDHARKYERKTV